MTKDEMVFDLTFDSTLMFLGAIILGTLSVGILGYAAVRYTFLSTLWPKSLFIITVKFLRKILSVLLCYNGPTILIPWHSLLDLIGTLINSQFYLVIFWGFFLQV